MAAPGFFCTEILLKESETVPAGQLAVIRFLGTASGTLFCPFRGPLRCALGVVGTTFGTLVCPLLGALGLGAVLRLRAHDDTVNRALKLVRLEIQVRVIHICQVRVCHVFHCTVVVHRSWTMTPRV